MPFTLAHPAIALPLSKYTRYFSMTALVLGSMSPDFEYFINFAVKRTIGHTFIGMFVMDIPLVILFSLVFHLIVKIPLLRHLPSPLSEWYYPYTLTRWHITKLSRMLVFVYSSLIGTLTHIIWDGFTHSNALFVQKICILNQFFSVGVYKIPVYKILQHGSSLLGLIAIFLFLLGIRCKEVSVERLSKGRKLYFWLTILTITVSLLIITNITYQFDSLIQLFGKLVTSFISSVSVGVILSCVIFRVRASKNNHCV
ncbi:MAG TPA: DUF4184 family protein [Patescibacteria group bacterium]|nr:DUF4184 family protein [Patescibacteria group bacterium]